MIFSPTASEHVEPPCHWAWLVFLCVMALAVALTQGGCSKRGEQSGGATAITATGEWSRVRVAQESHDIYWQIRDNPRLANNPPAEWFAGHPDRERLVAESINLWGERFGE